MQANRSAVPAAETPAVAAAARPRPPATTGAGVLVDNEEFGAFKAWRKSTCPDLATTALMASAAYLALVAEGVPVNADGFFTLVDLRRHLPKKQALRPGNFAKSAFIAADMSDPASVGEGLRQLVASSRAVPALFAGALSAALRRSGGEPVAVAAGPVTMTFNSMMRNPGVEHIPWTDTGAARYITMAYPVGAAGISVSACAVEGRVLFSASFDPGRLDASAVTRALERLRDMPALLEARLPDAAELLVNEAIERIASPTAGNGAR